MKRAKRTRIDKAGLYSIAERQGLAPNTLDSFSRDGLIRLIIRDGECDCGCGEGFSGVKPEWDHKIPVSIQYEGDAVHWQALRKDCHAIKTKQDVKDAAKCRRLRGETGQYARRQRRGGSMIKGRGFPKNLRKKMDGTVVRVGG